MADISPSPSADPFASEEEPIDAQDHPSHFRLDAEAVENNTAPTADTALVMVDLDEDDLACQPLVERTSKWFQEHDSAWPEGRPVFMQIATRDLFAEKSLLATIRRPVVISDMETTNDSMYFQPVPVDVAYYTHRHLHDWLSENSNHTKGDDPKRQDQTCPRAILTSGTLGTGPTDQRSFPNTIGPFHCQISNGIIPWSGSLYIPDSEADVFNDFVMTAATLWAGSADNRLMIHPAEEGIRGEKADAAMQRLHDGLHETVDSIPDEVLLSLISSASRLEDATTPADAKSGIHKVISVIKPAHVDALDATFTEDMGNLSSFDLRVKPEWRYTFDDGSARAG